jgi:hypothetical protein
MKKLFLSFIFFAGTVVAIAQAEKQDYRQEADQDKIQQEPHPAQLNTERNARITAQREENERIAKKSRKKATKKLDKEKAKAQAKEVTFIETPVLHLAFMSP